MPTTPLPAAMCISRFWAIVIAGCLFVVEIGAGIGFAQLPQARLYAIHPSGGQRGTSFELTLSGGTDLDEAAQLYFSHAGISAVQKTRQVEGKSEAIAGRFVVSIAPDVPPGTYDVRAHSLFGLSNPRTFTVGDLPETLEAEPNNAPEQAQPVDLGTVVNGRADSGADLDWYKLHLQVGQRVLITLNALRIDSRMDGVIELYAGGRRLARQRPQRRREPLLDFTAPTGGDYLIKLHDSIYGGSAEYFYRLSFSVGPHIDFILPASGIPNSTGEYTIFGRNLPGGQPSPLRAADGKILEQMKIAIAVVADPTTLAAGESLAPEEAGGDGIAYRLTTATGVSNPATIYFATAPTQVEREPNDQPEQPQPIVPPVEITGQFQTPGDSDLYQFSAKKGDVWWIEVFGQRTGSNADPTLLIEQVRKNDKGEETVARIAALDDSAANIGGNEFNTRTDDPAYRFVAPAEGTFRIVVRDRAFESVGDPSLVYRLSVRRESPDFRLVALPMAASTNNQLQQLTWDLSLRRGDNAQLAVMAFRRDNFDGPIDLSVEGLPPGVRSPGATIGPNQTSCKLVVAASEQAPEWQGTIRIVGRARIGSPARELVREARAGTIVWSGTPASQSAPQSRLARSLTLAVIKEAAPFQLSTELTRVTVNQGSQILVPLKLSKRNGFDANVNITFVAPPQNVQVENKPMPAKVSDQVHQIYVANNAPVGRYTLVALAESPVSYSRNPEAARLAAEEKESADKAAATAADAVKTAAEAKAAAEARAAHADASLRAAREAKARSDKNALAAFSAAAAAGEAAAHAGDALAKDGANESLKAAYQQAETAFTKGADNARKAAEEKAAADKALADAAVEARQAADARTAATARAGDAEKNAKAAATAKEAAERKAKETANAAKPQNLSAFSPTTIVVDIRPAPGTLTLTAGDRGTLKRGGKVEIKVKLNRIKEFTGPVELTLPLPAGVTGLSAAPVTIAADQSEGTLAISATADATTGQLVNMVVRASMQFNGPASIDQPLAIKVE